jgi:hypothetical protein
VVANTKDGQFPGVVEDVNEDGTLEILTDRNMKLSHVPADSVEKEEEGASGAMSLPAGVQSSRRHSVRKPLKASESGSSSSSSSSSRSAAAPRVKASPQGEVGAPAAAGDRLPAALDSQATMAVKAARQQFMAGTLDLTLMAAYHPAARDAVKAMLADKTLKFAASAFDKVESLDLGGGMTAKRAKKEEGEEVATIVVTDKDGKEVGKYPDAFGDDTVSIIKLFRQLLDINEKDDEKAAKDEKGGSESSSKPQALPKTEEPKKKSKEDEDKELEAAERAYNERLTLVRTIVADRVAKRYVVAQQDDIDSFLLKKMGLGAAMNAALKVAVERDVMRLLAMPDTELPSIRASLGSTPPRPTQVETPVSNEGVPLLSGLQLYAAQAEEQGLSIGGAFGSSYRR